jgi:hypothetical protein
VGQPLPGLVDVDLGPVVDGGVRALDVVADLAVPPGEEAQAGAPDRLRVAHDAHVLAAGTVALLALHAVFEAEPFDPLPLLRFGGGGVAPQADRRFLGDVGDPREARHLLRLRQGQRRPRLRVRAEQPVAVLVAGAMPFVAPGAGEGADVDGLLLGLPVRDRSGEGQDNARGHPEAS